MGLGWRRVQRELWCIARMGKRRRTGLWWRRSVQRGLWRLVQTGQRRRAGLWWRRRVQLPSRSAVGPAAGADEAPLAGDVPGADAVTVSGGPGGARHLQPAAAVAAGVAAGAGAAPQVGGAPGAAAVMVSSGPGGLPPPQVSSGGAEASSDEGPPSLT